MFAVSDAVAENAEPPAPIVALVGVDDTRGDYSSVDAGAIGPLVRRTRELIRDIEIERRCQQANFELLSEAAA